MNRERLERIEYNAERTALLTKPPQPLVTISDSDFEWLIEQVKHAQSLEQIKSDLINQIDVTQRRNERLEKRVQELETRVENWQKGRYLAVSTIDKERELKKRVQELEEKHKEYVSFTESNNYNMDVEFEKLYKQNKRYRELLKKTQLYADPRLIKLNTRYRELVEYIAKELEESE